MNFCVPGIAISVEVGDGCAVNEAREVIQSRKLRKNVFTVMPVKTGIQ
jgi:hypothetical protein